MGIGKFCRNFAVSYVLFCLLGVPLLNKFAIYMPARKDKGQLKIILNEEKSKLKMEDKNIQIVFNDKIENSTTRKTGENNYVMNLSKYQRNKKILKHESYHVAKGHCDRRYKEAGMNGFYGSQIRFFDYTFVMEPTAAIYSLTGIR